MATDNLYMSGRKKYSRPQAMLWCDNPGTVDPVSGFYRPTSDSIEGENFIILSDDNRSEISVSQQRIETRVRMVNGTMRSYHIADKLSMSTAWKRLPSRSYSFDVQFDSNGKALLESSAIVNILAGQKVGTYGNGTRVKVGDIVYGSYFPYGTSVTDVYAGSITFSNAAIDTLNNELLYFSPAIEYTTDGGAGGVSLLDWYENHTGPFYVYLSYDKYNNFKMAGEIEDQSFKYLASYNDIRLMYFASFNYAIEKRGGTNFDFWNIDLSLEEV